MNARPTTSPAPRRRLATLAALLLALIPGTLLAAAAPASAHAALVSSDPADGSRVASLPDEVTLEFNEEISDPAYVVVTAPDGVRVNSGDATVRGPRVTQALDAQGLALPAGSYTLAYRVVSADGHPISGEQTFEVETATAADPATETDRTDEGATEGGAAADDDWGATATGLVVAGVVALVVLAGALLLRARRGGTA
ncbi:MULTISPECIES: copper resistance CopC family protein [unclassified Nocardioides]|uniref:copper resistance CopC family protein n=1 Tax=unclassified Nocardioides TaxID=2615069 RepID=UPI001E4F0BF6|nr:MULTISPECIES: copper resistance CopC family protein [unclassified Nocardioides]